MFDYSIFMDGDSIRIRVCSNKNTSKLYAKFWEKINQLSIAIYSPGLKNLGYIKNEGNPNNEWDFYNFYWEFILNDSHNINFENRRSAFNTSSYPQYFEEINGKEYSWSQKRNEFRYLMKDNGGDRKFMSYLWNGMEHAIEINIERFAERAFGKENTMDLKINTIIPIPYSMNYVNSVNAYYIGIKVESDFFYIPAIQNKWENGTPLYEVKIKSSVPLSKKVIKKNTSDYQVKITDGEMKPYTIFDSKKLGTTFRGTPKVQQRSQKEQIRKGTLQQKFKESLFGNTKIRVGRK